MRKPFPLHHALQRLIDRAPKGLMAFLSVGVTGLAVHTGVFTVLFHLGVEKPLAWLCALAVATVLTWTLNRRLTFAASGRKRASEAFRYVLVTAVAQGVSFGVFLAAGRLAPWLPASLALIGGAVVATLFSYTGQRFFTFAAPQGLTPKTADALAVPEIPVI
jgi:putative flippase GtrA